MKLTVLGNRSPFPTKDGGCSSYLLQDGGQNILIDVGPGTLERLNKVIPYHKITAIIISHLHEDHFLDLLPLHYAIMLDIKRGKRKEALAVYLPFDEGRELDYLRSKVKEEYYLNQIDENTKLNFGDLNFSFKRSNHPKECYAMKALKEDKSLSYTADTGWDEGLIGFVRESDLLIAEASLLERDKDKRKMGHMTVKDSINFAKKAKVNKLLLSHLGSYYKKSDIDKEIENGEVDVELANINGVYNI
ncbi:MBL fold metallo-hydrolase [Halonatronum saccharophilum]|uniref:MBL fold metallo-hydrolase n=1 Tax=Halonatronum saccharophilum TaxID=150060 RepID=UPI0004891A4C|nr:MBL fold metallo-hydrolase [Halonatronum saccharophilum]